MSLLPFQLTQSLKLVLFRHPDYHLKMAQAFDSWATF